MGKTMALCRTIQMLMYSKSLIAFRLSVGWIHLQCLMYPRDSIAYEKYKGEVKQLKSTINSLYIEQRSVAPKLARQSQNNENECNNIATSSAPETEAKTKAKGTNHGSILFNNYRPNLMVYF